MKLGVDQKLWVRCRAKKKCKPQEGDRRLLKAQEGLANVKTAMKRDVGGKTKGC